MFHQADIKEAREFIEFAIALRQGQQIFRKELLRLYSGKCAVTGCDTVEALEAAHIIPYKGKETNHIQNGLLLRSDIHSLFDQKKLIIDQDYKIKLHHELLNGHYKELEQNKLHYQKTSQIDQIKRH